MSQNCAPKLILINPWIYDFTAYDLWSKPMGLLYLASFLRSRGFEIAYFDCLDKHAAGHKAPKIKKYGTGNFQRSAVEKPAVLGHVPRRFARYGVDEELLINFLKKHDDARAVLITSMMTYWYVGVSKTVSMVRTYLPDLPVILGGVYATLLPEHARHNVKPDYLITGPGESKVLDLLSKITDYADTGRPLPDTLDDFPYPAFDLVNHPDYLVMMTSRGCPYNCSFCAQKLISMPFQQRNPEQVLEEFLHQYRRFRIKDFAFYDDALFIRKDQHIKVILEGLIRKNMSLRLHAPNGLFAREIDAGLARLMYHSSFKTVCLSFETSNETRRKDMYAKVNNEDLIRAVSLLKDAGYAAGELESYVMMGLPGQDLEEVVASILFVHNLGVKVKLASYSPIPGTADFERAVRSGVIVPDIDPLLTNKSIFPLHDERMTYDIYRKLRTFSNILNTATERGLSLFHDGDLGPVLQKVIQEPV